MRSGTVVGIVISVVLGSLVYAWQAGKLGSAAGASTPAGIIDIVGVKTDLLSMAGAERQQFALEGKYLTFEELRAKGVAMPERRGPYLYSADVTDMTFTIKATYVAKAGEKPQPTMTIGPDMLVK